MKLLFLDINGVIQIGYNNTLEFDKKLVNNLNILLKKTGAYIVVTDPIRINNSLKYLNILFKSNGILAPVIGKTPYIKEGSNWNKKGKEILEYLIEHYPSCDSICIIDDWDKQIKEVFPAWYVTTDRTKGLTEYYLEDCIKTFNNPMHSYTLYKIAHNGTMSDIRDEY